MNFKRPLSLALMLGASSGLIGCQAPKWNMPSLPTFGRSAATSSAPDVSQQKYDGLSQEYAGSPRTPAPTSGMGGVRTAPEENMFSSTWSKTSAAVTSVFSTKPREPENDDPTRLSSKPTKIGADVYISAARIFENQGKLDEAAEKYQQALKVAPDDVTTLVSLARLQDRQRKPHLAVQTYEKAIKLEPKNALVHNDLGLCYARQGLVPESLAQLQQAVNLQPANSKYHNNLASVLVEAGRLEEAFAQLARVNPPAVAHFNMGFLLHKRGQNDAAAAQLQMALAADPNMAPARAMLAEIGPASPQMATVPPEMQGGGYYAPAQTAPVQRLAPAESPYQGVPTNAPSMSDALRRISHEEDISPATDLTVHIAPPEEETPAIGPVSLSISDDGECQGSLEEPNLLP